MGLTISDIHKKMYAKWRGKGMTHEEAMQNIPEEMRGDFVKDLGMSSIESHFGVKEKWFYLILIATLIVPFLGMIILMVVLT